ncbi:MAG: hypothetical protein RIT45_1489 [Pseudomonadota bacterium]
MNERFDAIIVGAGSAGSAAAWQIARRGLRVAVLDARGLDDAGARWVNGVPPWMFEHAGLALPQGEELRSAPGAGFVMADASATHRVDMRPSPVLAVDMRALNARIRGLAAQAGAQFREHRRVRDVDLEGGRVRAVRTAEGERFVADLFVDAAGLAGVLRDVVPDLRAFAPDIARSDLCSAAQQVHAVADRAALRRFLERHRLQPGDAFSRVGVAGGFSTVMMQTSADLEHIEILTGAVATAGVPTGRALLDDAVARHPFVGARLFGGAGVIPLRRSWDRLGAGGVMLLGDAACQVFPAHGSGVGPGLVAAMHLGAAIDHVAHRGGDPGDDAVLWDATARYQRDIGAVAAAYDVFRRYTANLSAADQAAVIAAGMMTEDSARAGLAQQMPLTDPSALLGTLSGALRVPRLALRLGPAVARMQAVFAAYRRYPQTPHLPALRAFSDRVRLLAGEA